MKEINKKNILFEVDIEKTKQYYIDHSLCSCLVCRNYYAQIKEMLPDLQQFLIEFGVDICKPDEISWFEEKNSIFYSWVDYTVCGHMKNCEHHQFYLQADDCINIEFHNGYVSPNEQTGDYFTISIISLSLPWVLNETLSHDITRFQKMKNMLYKKIERKK